MHRDFLEKAAVKSDVLGRDSLQKKLKPVNSWRDWNQLLCSAVVMEVDDVADGGGEDGSKYSIYL